MNLELGSVAEPNSSWAGQALDNKLFVVDMDIFLGLQKEGKREPEWGDVEDIYRETVRQKERREREKENDIWRGEKE
eukprot:1393720-Amorphochlora_amoeboformis.AAC.1